MTPLDSYSAAAAAPLQKLRRYALVVGGIGIVCAIIGWIATPESFYRAYLHSWLLWLDVSLGSLGITMLIHQLGGSWGFPLRRLAEAAAMVLPLLVILFIPIAVGAGTLFPWGYHHPWQQNPILVQRHPYLNQGFFIGRAVIYAVCWLVLAILFWTASRKEHVNGVTPRGGWLYVASGIGLVVYILTMGLFASTDWVMSMEPQYKSTAMGLIVILGQGVSGLCVVIAALALLCPRILPKDTVSADDWNDIGSVLLTITMLWCYLELCQFIINWMANLQNSNIWYFHRMHNGWFALSWVLVGLHLVLPLLVLMSRTVKRTPSAMLVVCVILLITRGIEGFWAINPSGSESLPLLSARFSWLDVVLPIGVGGLWVAAYTFVLERAPLLIERPAIAIEGASHVA